MFLSLVLSLILPGEGDKGKKPIPGNKGGRGKLCLVWRLSHLHLKLKTEWKNDKVIVLDKLQINLKTKLVMLRQRSVKISYFTELARIRGAYKDNFFATGFLELDFPIWKRFSLSVIKLD